MPEEQVETLDATAVVNDKAEFAPVRTAETRALIARSKEQGWKATEDIRSLVEVRDILEFAAVRNMASAIQEASNKLAELSNLREAYSRDQAEQIFDEIITSPDRNLSQQQREALERGRDTILDSVDEFNTWRNEHTEDDVYSLLGGRFTEVDRSKLRIDTTRFPCAVVVEATDTGTYQAIRDKETSLGFYSEALGEGILKGRILVVNATEAHEDTDRHEYQHFLFTQASKDVEFFPEVSERKLREIKRKMKKESKENKAEIRATFEEAKDMLLKSSSNKKISDVVPDYRNRAIKYHSAFGKKLLTLSFFMESAHRTYPEGAIKDAFINFKDEFMAYTSGGGKKARFETYFGDSLKQAERDPFFERFQAETDLLKGSLALAQRKGVSNDRIGYLVGSSRNMQQAAKFVYLETQMDEIQSELAKTAQSKEPVKKEINLEALSKGFNETTLTGNEFDK